MIFVNKPIKAKAEVVPSSSLVEVEVEVGVEVPSDFKLFLRVGGWWMGGCGK